MILNYKMAKTKYRNENNLKLALRRGELFKLEKGIYSRQANVSELEVITFKNPKAVFASESAYYFHDLTDYVPDKYFLATPKDAYKIRDKRVKQVFYLDKQFGFGIQEIKYDGVPIKVYDKERMLIELIRKKSKLPFDYYKEIIRNYRDIIEKLDIQKIEDYIEKYESETELYNKIMLEVFWW